MFHPFGDIAVRRSQLGEATVAIKRRATKITLLDGSNPRQYLRKHNKRLAPHATEGTGDPLQAPELFVAAVALISRTVAAPTLRWIWSSVAILARQ
jgi:hypothetical protein